MTTDHTSQPKMRYLEYLSTCRGGKEHYSFDDQSEATAFGEGLRKNIAHEEGIDFWELDQIVTIRVGYLTVRIDLAIPVEDECVNVNSY